MGIASKLPTVEEARKLRPLTQKFQQLPSILTKKARQQSKDQQAADFRAAVWHRDGGKSRATGKPLSKSGMDPERVGEVDHAIPRSLAPDRLYDVSNGILLSKWENRARKVVCPEAPEFKLFDYTGPDDRGLPQTFIWRRKDGSIIKQRVG